MEIFRKLSLCPECNGTGFILVEAVYSKKSVIVKSNEPGPGEAKCNVCEGSCFVIKEVKITTELIAYKGKGVTADMLYINGI